MKKTNLNVQGIELTAKANVPKYIPFANAEIVTGILFEDPTGYSVKVVEDFKEISNDDNDFKSVDFGNLKTVCLVVTTAKDTILTVLTLNKQ